MVIRKLAFKGLHGYLDKKIAFNPDINMLVGINGSGKTSILNVINWLLQPSLPRLCVTQFKSISLTFSFEGTDGEIKCEQTSSELRYFIRIGSEQYMSPLVVQLNRPASELRTAAEQEEMLLSYERLSPDKDEQAAWNTIRLLPSPIVVGLERTLGLSKAAFFVSHAKAVSLGRTPKNSDAAEFQPLNKVQQLTASAHSRYRSRMLELNERLRNKIILSAFDIGVLPGASSVVRRVRKEDLISEEQLSALEKKFVRYLDEDGRSASARQRPMARTLAGDKHFELIKIQRYFDRLKVLLKQSKSTRQESGPLWDLILGQFRKLNRLYRDFERFEADSESAHAEIKLYISTINHFLRDSAKELHFHSVSNELSFSLLDERGAPDKTSRNIELLSSGEKQILILLTYLAFSPGKIFVIDEPELSLHPKWQDEFLEKVKGILPPDTQLILATHSPAIVGKNVEFCQPLLPFKS